MVRRILAGTSETPRSPRRALRAASRASPGAVIAIFVRSALMAATSSFASPLRRRRLAAVDRTFLWT